MPKFPGAFGRLLVVAAALVVVVAACIPTTILGPDTETTTACPESQTMTYETIAGGGQLRCDGVPLEDVYCEGGTATSIPSGVRCEGATTTTVPPGPAWPNDATTGYKACGLGLGDLTPMSGGITLGDNAVLENFDLTGSVTVTGSNVIVRCGRIRSSGIYGIVGSTAVEGEDYTIDAVEIESTAVDATGGKASAGIGPYGAYVASRVNIWRFRDGVKVKTDHTIMDSWIHDLWATGPDPHNDGMQSVGGRNVNILRNNIEGPYQAQNAALILGAGTTPYLENYTIAGNRLHGGGFTVYIGGKDGNPTPQNIVVRDNVWVRDSWTFGPLSLRLNWPAGDPGAVWEGNTFDDGAPYEL